jgi:hypothetical protein
MKPIDRRDFLKSSLLGVTAVSLSGHQSLAAQTPARSAANSSAAPGIIDTNVNLLLHFSGSIQGDALLSPTAKPTRCGYFRLEAMAQSFEHRVHRRYLPACAPPVAGSHAPYCPVETAI